MSMSLAELSALPTAPTVSKALAEAAHHVGEGPFIALRMGMFGSATFDSFIAAVTPEYAIAEGIALIVAASLIDPEVRAAGLPDNTWTAGEMSVAVGAAHRILGSWARRHSAEQLAHLFEAAADRAGSIESGRWEASP